MTDLQRRDRLTLEERTSILEQSGGLLDVLADLGHGESVGMPREVLKKALDKRD